MRKLALAFVTAAVGLVVASAVLDVDLGRGVGEEGGDESPKLFYVVEPGRSLVLAVEPDTTRVKLVCLLQLPADAAPSPDASYEFGFDATVLAADGREVWSTPVWLETRRTVEPDPPEGGEPRRRTWLVAEDAPLTDERVIELDLGPLAGQGGDLRLDAHAGREGSLLLRPYRRMPLAGDEAASRLRTIEERRRQLMARRVGASTWREIDAVEQQQLSSFRWYRMEARGARVRDYVTRLVVLGDYRGEPDVEAARWHYLEPGRALALNLRGPATVTLQVERIEGGEAAASASLVSVSQWGEISMQALRLEGEGGVSHTEHIPPGDVVSLSVVDDGRAPLRVSATTRDVPLGIFAGTSASYDRDTGRYRLGPDLRILRMHRIVQQAAPLEFELRSHPAGLDRVRVEARAAAGEDVPLTAELLDAAGRTLSSSTIRCPAGPSPFEVAGTLDPGAMPTPAGLPTRVEMWVGEGAATLRLSSGVPVDVVVSVPTTDTWERSVPEEPYRIDSDGVALRYAPLVDRTWVAAHPRDVAALAAAGREVVVSAQVRLEPADAALVDGLVRNPLGWDPAVTTRRSGVAWEPEGMPRRQRLLERGGGTGPGYWPVGSWASLVAGEPARIALATQRDLRLALWLDDPTLLGQTVEVRADGRLLAEVLLAAEQMEMDLGPLAAGDHEVVLHAPGPGVVALVDQPPRGRAGVDGTYRSRTVHRLDAAAPLRATLPVPHGADAVLYVLPYFEQVPGQGWPGSLPYRLEIGGQRPPCQPFERVTPLGWEGVVEPAVAEAGFMADRREHGVVAAAPIRIPIGDDLEGSAVDVILHRLDGGARPVWARLVAYGVPGRPDRDSGQWTEEAAVPDEAWVWADPFVPGPPVGEIVGAALVDPEGPFVRAPEGALDEARALGWNLAGAARTGSTEALPVLAARASALGFVLQPLRSGDERLLVLREAEPEGRGLLVLRFGEGGHQLVLQAPHAFHDLVTGALAADLMVPTGARALLVNTRHRHSQGAPAGEAPLADLAHREDTWFHALTLGVLDALDSPLLVQVHGFAADSLDDPAIDVVASGGANPRQDVVGVLVDALRVDRGAAAVAAYPDDVQRLGGVTNVQGRAVGVRPAGAFLSLELGLDYRQQLRTDAGEFERLSDALVLTAVAVEPAEGGP